MDMWGDEVAERLAKYPELTELVLNWLLTAARPPAPEVLLGEAARQVQRLLGVRRLVVLRAHGEPWLELERLGGPAAIPPKLVAEVLDADAPSHAGDWSAALVDRRHAPGLLLAVQREDATRTDSAFLDRLSASAVALGAVYRVIDQQRELLGRWRRSQALLKIVAQWNQHRETETLLAEMARTSTELFDAERASIFLWDRAHHELVGRPALGIDGGELRVPDDRGVVGRVVQQGEPLVVDEREAQQWVDRSVDQKLGFRTRNLVCVPLRNRQGIVLGAFELINKRQGNFQPADLQGLLELADHAALAIETSQHIAQLLAARRQMADAAAADIELVGQTPAMQQLRETIRRLAPTDLAVLVTGENGTGKEVVSRMIHYLSPRRDQPFIAVNCAALAETLIESELFGHEKGAFTDARETKRGKFELASGGTLFLDEIGDLSPSGQAKLLRVLEDKVVVRVGGAASLPVDTRVIAATNQDLAAMVRAKKFRQDLFFRLNVVLLHLPPLRDRSDDVVPLAEHFLALFCRKARRPELSFSAEARQRLKRHPWPGNVRELRNLTERLAFLHSGDTIGSDDLAFVLAPSASSDTFDLGDAESLPEATRQFQIHYIRRQIAAAGGNVTDAARRLGLHRSNLYRKMRQLNMDEAEGTDDDDLRLR